MRWTALALLSMAGMQDPVCDHGTRGAARRIDLQAVARVHEVVKRRLLFGPVPAGEVRAKFVRFELPACRTRNVRRVSIDVVPEGLPELHFSRDGIRIPDQGAADRLGIRCTPTRLRRISSSEVELVEGD